MPIACSVHERSRSLTLGTPRVVHAGLVVQEQPRQVQVAIVTGFMERGPTTVVPGVDLCTLREDQRERERSKEGGARETEERKRGDYIIREREPLSVIRAPMGLLDWTLTLY